MISERIGEINQVLVSCVWDWSHPYTHHCNFYTLGSTVVTYKYTKLWYWRSSTVKKALIKQKKNYKNYRSWKYYNTTFLFSKTVAKLKLKQGRYTIKTKNEYIILIKTDIIKVLMYYEPYWLILEFKGNSGVWCLIFCGIEIWTIIHTLSLLLYSSCLSSPVYVSYIVKSLNHSSRIKVSSHQI